MIKLNEFAATSRNIILELPGRGEGVVILGAHYDNASATGVLLALAEDAGAASVIGPGSFDTPVYSRIQGRIRHTWRIAVKGLPPLGSLGGQMVIVESVVPD